MGLLRLGRPLAWDAAIPHLEHVREHGLEQFLHVYNAVKDIHNDDLLWGDEIEYHIMRVDPVRKTIQIALRGREIMEQLNQREVDNAHFVDGCTWHPEFGSWMVEGTPRQPFTGYASDLLRAERNMLLRRRRLLSVLGPNEIAPTVTSFPLLGVGNFYYPETAFEVPFSQSMYVADICINPHPRFGTLVQNIRARRGSKVDIRVPLFRDRLTPEFLDTDTTDATGEGVIWQLDAESNGNSQPETRPIYTRTSASGTSMIPEGSRWIHMDHMAFGMGQCCLQVTFQGRDVCESRYLYDQLAIVAPIMLALTAATPILKGRLADTDVRWGTIAGSVDDRTPAERGLLSDSEREAAGKDAYAGKGIRRIPKSRYDSISTFLYHCRSDLVCERSFDKFNDVPCPVDEQYKKMLISNGIDANLAHHIAHLFIRDPLVIFEDGIDLDDTKSTDHFENIQSTNWQTVRWKPPPPASEGKRIGWRTEFRSMEVQLTDFENAAFTTFIVLLSRVILSFDLILYVPLSKVDENMRRAHVRDAVRTQRFFFRRFMAPPGDVSDPEEAKAMDEDMRSSCTDFVGSDMFEEMTLDEIFHGKGTSFPGLIPLVRAYLEFIHCDKFTFRRVDEYLDFISKRARGDIYTAAQWMRKFVQEHPSYSFDSVVTEDIAYDLMVAAKAIGEGKLRCPELLGGVIIDPVDPEDAYERQLLGRLAPSEKAKLVQKFFKRPEESDQIQRQGSFSKTLHRNLEPTARPRQGAQFPIPLTPEGSEIIVEDFDATEEEKA